MAESDIRVDVAVVGAGPAGQQAALEVAEAGGTVAVVDANERPGGQYHRQPSTRLGAATPGSLHHGWGAAEDRQSRLEALASARLLTECRVWALERGDAGFRVHTASVHDAPRAGRTGGERAEWGAHGHEGVIEATQLVLATGATERVLPFPGWDLPGVLTAGGAQALLKSQGIRPGHRVVVAGAGPLLLPVASALAQAGTGVVEVCDAAERRAWLRAGKAGLHTPRKPFEALGSLRRLAAARIPYRPGTAVLRADGDGRVEQVTIARVDASWRAVPGTQRTVDVDALCVSHGFVPSVEAAAALGCALTATTPPSVRVDRLQRTSVPGVLAAGEVTGVSGAEAAVAEGGVAGMAAAKSLGLPLDPRRRRRHTVAREREHRAAASLGPLFRLPEGWRDWLEDDTVICRCEDVPYGDVRHAIVELGAGDLRSVKMTTRCGMGYCQARTCGPVVSELVRQLGDGPPADPAGLSSRAIITPVPLGRL